MISRNETIAIPKVEIFVLRLLATDFTLPFVRDSQLHLYISPKMEHDNMWMVKVFSWKIWCIILIMCVLLSLCTFVIQNVQTRNKDKKRENVSFIEHLFYSFGNLCSQGYIPQNLYGKSRILEVSLGLFCSVICMSFGAVLFTYIMKNIFVPPFNNLKSLLTDTT
ncbi:PREDICTED: uncharacterized protein LOC105460076, partial [Wasmannia auropunctata]|uniref:uncharacterized protein LOC105460076 n=1 Tax=Wasmannia auropunctata TaxID=64793 RepID=UPI0005F0BE6D